MAQARTPPGRAGRLRLRRNLAAARRGADLLDQKVRILRAHHRRLQAAERTTEEQWRQSLRAAEQWLIRGLLLDGADALAAAAVPPSADVETDWSVLMGVRRPTGATVAVPDLDPESALPANSALLHASTAYRQALAAAARHAAARTATRLIGAEVQTTRRRLRALQRHWIPRLERTLAGLDQALEQAEHEDAVRRRWAAESADPGPSDHRSGRGGPSPEPRGTAGWNPEPAPPAGRSRRS